MKTIKKTKDHFKGKPSPKGNRFRHHRSCENVMNHQLTFSFFYLFVVDTTDFITKFYSIATINNHVINVRIYYSNEKLIKMHIIYGQKC